MEDDFTRDKEKVTTTNKQLFLIRVGLTKPNAFERKGKEETKKDETKRKREKKKEKNHRRRRRRRRRHNIAFRAKDYLRATNMAPAAKKGSKKIQSFVVDCTRPVRIDCVARIVVASKSDDDFLFCGEGSPHHRTNVVKIARVSAWSFLEGCEA